METVVVTGIRASLQKSLDIKRDSAGLVDAITMEDIGKFPDANLANALMRIPGVTTSATSSATNNGQSTTTGQGVSITVRGFGPQFNETLFDGRLIPSAGNATQQAKGPRSFDFSMLSADMVARLEVLKSPDAAMSAGAIGATINVIYPKPFDKPGFTLAASASGTINTDDGRWMPNGNFLISNTFANDKVGVLLAGAYYSYQTSQWQVQNWGWNGQYLAPCQLATWSGADCNDLPSMNSSHTIPAGGSIWLNPANGAEVPSTFAGAVRFNSLANSAPGVANGTITSTLGAGTALINAGPGSDTLINVSIPHPATLQDTTKPVWWTQDYAVDWNQINEERINLRAAAQFRPTDALEITVDANFARDDLMQDSLTYALWNGVSDMRNVKVSSVGTVTEFTRYPTGTNGAPQDFDDVRSQYVQQTLNWGINLKFNASEHLTVVADYSYALAAQNPDGQSHLNEVSAGIGYGPSSAAGIYGVHYTVTQPGGHGLPFYTNVGPTGTGAYFTGLGVPTSGPVHSADGSILGSHVMVVNNRNNTYLVNQAKLEADYEYDNLKVKLGAQYSPNHFISHTFTDLFGGSNNNWQVVSGYGPDSNNFLYPGAIAGFHLPSSLFNGVKSMKADSIPGWTAPAGGVIPGLPITNAYEIYSYLNSKTGTSITCPALPGGGFGVPTPNGVNCGALSSPAGFHGMIPSLMPDESKSQFTKLFEDDYAMYVSFATEAKVADMPLKISGGVRWEYTQSTSTGYGQPLVAMPVTPGDLTAYRFDLGPATEISKQNAYSYLLPNVDLTLFVTDAFHVRFDASRTMTRPPIAFMGPANNYNGRKGSLVSIGGNPDLLPFVSDNVDVAAEWYYADNSYLSANVYLKNVQNFITQGNSTEIVNGVIDPNTGTAAVFSHRTQINNAAANVYGLEVSWQHVFGDSGFGYLLNGTIVQTNKPYDPTNIQISQFAVAGLADSANATVFYDKDGFQLRFAANWRDTYLDQFGQGQGNGSFGTEPIFVNGNWDLTVSGGYDITDNINAYFTATNLLNNSYSTRGRYPDQVYGVISVGRTYTAGVHFKL